MIFLLDKVIQRILSFNLKLWSSYTLGITTLVFNNPQNLGTNSWVQVLMLSDQKLAPQSNLEKENVQPAGALENGEWRIISQFRDVDVYEVSCEGKTIRVIAEVHGTKETQRELMKALAEVSRQPQVWILLMEHKTILQSPGDPKSWGISFAPGSPPDLFFRSLLRRIDIGSNNFKVLPGLYDGVPDLLTSHLAKREEVALAVGIKSLSDFGKILGHDESADRLVRSLLRDKTTIFTEIASIQAEQLSQMDIPIGIDEMRTLLFSLLNRPAAVPELVRSANQTFEMAYGKSDDKQRKIVEETLGSDYPYILIKIGKGHLGSLIRSGNIAEYTKRERQLHEIKLDDVQRALQMETVIQTIVGQKANMKTMQAM